MFALVVKVLYFMFVLGIWKIGEQQEQLCYPQEKNKDGNINRCDSHQIRRSDKQALTKIEYQRIF